MLLLAPYDLLNKVCPSVYFHLSCDMHHGIVSKFDQFSEKFWQFFQKIQKFCWKTWILWQKHEEHENKCSKTWVFSQKFDPIMHFKKFRISEKFWKFLSITEKFQFSMKIYTPENVSVSWLPWVCSKKLPEKEV